MNVSWDLCSDSTFNRFAKIKNKPHTDPKI